VGQFRFVLGAVDGGVGAGVYHEIGLEAAYRIRKGRQVGDVQRLADASIRQQARTGGGDHSTLWSQAFEQRMANLAIGTDD
jgi:hypothetical protein